MSEDCVCSLRHTATQAVPGAGNASAEVLFIGEAPGKNEDLQGVPFVGAAGKFLDEMLDSIGMRRDDIYITNIVKYRPPDNRDPLPEEIRGCSEWLHEQIGIIDPLLIVTLGRHAMNHFFPDLRISESHGKAFRTEFPQGRAQVFYALYHPAAALYNGGMRETLKQDFLRIPALLRKLRPERE
ncbi:MAG: uracil-DNA glycosylase [Candidatus Moranbacteria bacterium]|nr:uracil-DNA glycosylase [Candidatus Moranbacteria bacterium]